MKALTAESAVTIPTPSNIFGGGDELLYEAVREAHGEMLSEAGPGAGARGLDCLLSSLSATAETMAREPSHARTLLESLKTPPGRAPSVRRSGRAPSRCW